MPLSHAALESTVQHRHHRHLFLLSHLILDSFNGGVTLFYPLSIQSYPLVFDIFYRGGHLVPVVGVGAALPRIFSEEAVTSLGVGILLTFVAGALFSYRPQKSRLRR